uniref:DUF7194 family protein n=1 Tax=Caballeronia arationis TaxID=1777142 RepID=UPI0011982304|nr:hypothetical protein [Caballeronia arationis]
MPSQNNVPYTSIVLGVHCGALPDSLDLTYVKSKVSLAVQDAIGVTPTIKSLAVSAKTLISQTEHAAITSTRNAAISQAGTPTAQLLALKDQLTSSQQQVTSLTSFISSMISAGLIDANGNIVSSGGGDVSNTLDPQSLPDGLVLEDDNLTVAAPMSFGAARSIVAHNSGLYYVEATIVRFSTAVGLGLVNGREDLASVGSDGNGIMAFCGTDAGNGVKTNNAFISTTQSKFNLSAGDTLGMAINLDAKLVWFLMPETGLWNGDESADPVGNVGGIDISGIMSAGYNGYVYPCAMVEMTGDGGVLETADTVTVNLGDQAFVNTAPSGYSVWGHTTTSGGDGGNTGGGGTTPTVTATFDSSVLPSGMVLQSSNMTVVGTKNEWQTARTTYGQSSGLLYAEATINRLTGAVGFGICNQLEAPNGELGADANGIMMYTNMSKVTSGIFYLGATVNAIGSQAPMQGSTVGIAVNLSAKLIWFYNPITQQWNGGTPTEQNPEGNIGGISIASICTQDGLAAQVFPAVSTWQISDSVTYNPGSSTFVNSVPVGYKAWNTESVSS